MIFFPNDDFEKEGVLESIPHKTKVKTQKYLRLTSGLLIIAILLELLWPVLRRRSLFRFSYMESQGSICWPLVPTSCLALP